MNTAHDFFWVFLALFGYVIVTRLDQALAPKNGFTMGIFWFGLVLAIIYSLEAIHEPRLLFQSWKAFLAYGVCLLAVFMFIWTLEFVVTLRRVLRERFRFMADLTDRLRSSPSTPSPPVVQPQPTQEVIPANETPRQSEAVRKILDKLDKF